MNQLIGSEAQIKWANDIRAKRIAEQIFLKDTLRASPGLMAKFSRNNQWLKELPFADRQAITDGMNQILLDTKAELLKNNSAEFWIETRETSLAFMVIVMCEDRISAGLGID